MFTEDVVPRLVEGASFSSIVLACRRWRRGVTTSYDGAAQFRLA